MVRYNPIDKQLFIYNRQNFCKHLKVNSLAVFQSNDVMPSNADGTLGFRQSSDIFYLSGIDQEETILMLFPDCPDAKHREILFVRETNEYIITWEGYKLTKEQARQQSGVETVYWTHQFDQVLNLLAFACEYLYLNTNEHNRATIAVETREMRFAKDCQHRFPLHKYERTAPIMHQLRAIKYPLEIDLMKKAVQITEKGFRRILSFVEPNVTEYEIEAEFAHEFVRNKAVFAYTPIIASGADACILHYNDNYKTCLSGDLLLLDVAAAYANYASDLTRTVPVNGRFSKRQREVYQAVLRVFKEARQMLVSGNLWEDYQKEAGKIMEKELIGLKLLDANEVAGQDPEKPLYKKYFPHGTSHFLGLDVHDVGNKYRKFEPGMVFTCEPGIYIREEGIGIRLENNILITEGGNIDLMASIPIEAEEIETLMNEKK
jgi:Xaa-Pro aminopeptidase